MARAVTGGTPSLLVVYLSDEDVLGVLFVMRVETVDRRVLLGRAVDVAKQLDARTGFISSSGLDLSTIVRGDEHLQELHLSWDETDKQILRFFIR